MKTDKKNNICCFGRRKHKLFGL